MRQGSGTDLARERDAVAAITVLERFEIAVVTSISAWDSGGMRRVSPSLSGVESHGGICRQSTASEKPRIIVESHVRIGTCPDLMARISQLETRVGTALPPNRNRLVSLPLEE